MPAGLRRVLTGGLTGLAALVGPALLDLWASSALEAAFARALGARLDAKVEVGQVRSMGPASLRLHDLRVTWAGPGLSRLDLPRVDLSFSTASLLRLRPALTRVSLPGGRLRWERPDAQASLRRLYRRLRGAPVKSGGPRRGGRVEAGARLDASFEQVLIRELGPRRGNAPTRLEVRSLGLRRAAGLWQGAAAKASVDLVSGARLELGGLGLRGRERGAAGPRVTWLRVSAGRWTPPGSGPGRSFTLVADELAPDLLQVRLEAPGAGPRDRLQVAADVDGRKRTTRSHLLLEDLQLGSLYPWPSPVGLGFRRSLLSGAAEIQTRGTRSAHATGTARLDKLVIHHPRLSPVPVTFPPATVAGRVRWDRRAARLRLEDTSLKTGRATLRLDGELSLRPRGGRAKVVLPATGCMELFASLPAGLVPTLRGLRLAGALGGELSLVADARALDDLTLDVIGRPNACRVLADAPLADVEALRRPFSFVIRPPAWPPTRLIMGPENPDWVPYVRLGRNVIGAFLAAEDRRFFAHQGFDLENIRRAFAADLRSRGFAKGASSITQQVAKNVFLTHRRTLARKLEEAILTWRMEQVLDKRRILEIYLNLVEMGPGLFGVRAAARHYFRKEPSHLDPLEAAHLAAITPSPQACFERFREGRAGMDWLLHLRWLLYQMHRLAWLDRPSYERARQKDLRLLSYDSPRPAPPPYP